jgi:hypothetical protein
MGKLLNSDSIHSNFVVRKNVAYIAETIWDSASDYRNPFGSSYCESFKYAVEYLLHNLSKYGALIPDGPCF